MWIKVLKMLVIKATDPDNADADVDRRHGITFYLFVFWPQLERCYSALISQLFVHNDRNSLLPFAK